MWKSFIIFPKMLIPIIIYYFSIGRGLVDEDSYFTIIGGVEVSWMGFIVFISMIFAAIEIAQSAIANRSVMINFGFSFLLLIALWTAILKISAFATETAVLINSLIVIEIAVGFVVIVIATQRDVQVGPGVIGGG